MWFRQFPSSKRRQARIVCFHHAGGSSQVFRSWTKWLEESIEVVAIELPGHGTRFEEELIPTAEEIASNLIPELLPLFDQPIFFLGHSMGAILAFETVRQLIQLEANPVHLYLIGAEPPHFNRKRVSQKEDHLFLRDIRALGGMPLELLQDDEVMSFLLPILRNDFQLTELYQQHVEIFPCPITVYGGDQDFVAKENLEKWIDVNPHCFSLEIFLGNHFFLHNDHRMFQRSLRKSLQQQMQGKTGKRYA